ncbi:unnamed protein product [Mesocestoides corti]|uniref:Uncharacterized protein n=1 Tax=Mesocestoides corti TaxID=53468 RepID=A0A158QTK1_MESCO|nr:unnamed protein product [Mesocestoides corti]
MCVDFSDEGLSHSGFGAGFDLRLAFKQLDSTGNQSDWLGRCRPHDDLTPTRCEGSGLVSVVLIVVKTVYLIEDSKQSIGTTSACRVFSSNYTEKSTVDTVEHIRRACVCMRPRQTVIRFMNLETMRIVYFECLRRGLAKSSERGLKAAQPISADWTRTAEDVDSSGGQ